MDYKLKSNHLITSGATMSASLLRVFMLTATAVLLAANAQQDGTTNFIDQDSKLTGYAEPSWFKANIPFIELPDQEIEDVYYYRWSSLKRHLRFTVPGAGYTVTEFVHKVFYSQKWDTINAAAGHHIYEARWLRDRRYVQDYINFWAREGGAAQQYSEWIADASYASYLIDGDVEFIKSQQTGLINNYNGWYDRYDPQLNLFFITPHDDAQEMSAASVQTDDPYHGGLGYRPSFNSEMYGNAMAIAKIARLNGDFANQLDFENRARTLRQAILLHLWDPYRGFFYHRQRLNNPDGVLLDTREEVGFYPWRFNVPHENNETMFERAWQYFAADDVFNSAFGPSTCDQNSQWYDGDQVSQCCWWNGNSWPYSTALTLGALASQVRNYGATLYANIESYVAALHKYARTQYKNGRPYVAECHSPVGDFWVCDGFNHSEHYAHSTYTDNVLFDLIGVQPVEEDFFELWPLIPSSWPYFALENLLYHGHNLSVIYDSDGSRYNIGSGLYVFVNGELVTFQLNLGPISVEIPPPRVPVRGAKTLENYATNPEIRGYPRPNASWTDQHSSTWHAIDGRIFYDYVPVNRWSNFESPNDVEWYEVDLGPGRSRILSQVKIYVYSDVVTGEGRTDCPKSMVVQVYESPADMWREVAATNQCEPNSVNTLDFAPTRTQRIRVLFERDTENNYYIGITELELWAEFPQTNADGEYEFEDGFLNQAIIVGSDRASSGSYVGEMSEDGSSAEVTGIWMDSAGEVFVDVYYANGGTALSTLGLVVNNGARQEVAFPPTLDGWSVFETFVTHRVTLLRGNNNIVFRKGENVVELDRIIVRKVV